MNHQKGESDASDKATTAKSNRIMIATAVEILALGLGLGVAINGLFYSWPRGNKLHTILAGAAAIIFVTIGIAAHLIGMLPPASPPDDDPSKVALKRLIEQGDAKLRPYLGVSGLTATMEIGKPVSVVVKFTNNGETPADDAEIRARLEKLPVGVPLDRHYDGEGFERVSRTSVNRGNTIEAEIVSRDENTAQLLTLDDVMQLNTDKTHYLAAHGVVRYRSQYIPGGSDETPFCFELEPMSGQWIVCRVEASQKNTKG